jgi:hypothetical protein
VDIRRSSVRMSTARCAITARRRSDTRPVAGVTR